MKPVEVEILMKGNSLSHGLDDARQKSDLLTSSLRRLSQTAAGVLSVREALEFGKAMIRVRSEIEKLEISFETLLGNKGAASELMTELKTFAARTPLQLNDLAQAEQTLLAFNVPAEETVGILHAIGDISMGDSQKLQSLTLAFSQMSSTGNLMGQDLMQMINAGFNPLSVISEKTGKSIGELKEAMSDGAISADMVREAFISATSEGGKFYKMLEKQSESQAGSMSNLQGAWNDMLNDIGTKTQDTVSGSIQMLTSLVKNYEQVGRIVTGLIATYGAYKAAVMFATAAEKGWTIAELAHFRALTLATKAQALMNATMLANPYVLAATAIVGLVAAVWALHDSTTAAEREAARLKEREDEQQEELSDLKKKIDDLLGVVEDETSAEYDRQKALEDLKELMPSVFGKYKTEKELLEDLTAARKAENEEISRRNNLLGKQNYNEDKSQLSQWQRYRELHNKSNGHADPLRGNYGGLSREEYYEMQGIWERTILPNRNKTKSEFESFDSWLNNQIKALSGTVNQEAEKERQKAATSWNSKLQTMDVKELEGDIDRNKKRLKTMDESGKDYILMDGIPIHRSELKRRIKEGSSRKKTLLENGRKDFAKDAKTQLEAEQKTLRSLASLSDPEKRGKSQMTYNGKKVRGMNASEYETAIKEQQKKVDAAQGKVDSFDKASNGGKKPKDTSAKEQRKQTQDKLGQELAELQRSNDAAEIETMQEGLQKKLREIENEYQQRKNAIDKQESNWKRDNVKAGIATGDNGLTADQTAALQKARDQAAAIQKKEIADANKEARKGEIEAMVEYLREYGSYQQQKLAIAKEYEQKIADVEASGVEEATKQWQKKKLNKERLQKEASLTFDNISRGIDWHALFSGVGDLTKEMMRPMMAQLQAWVETDDYRHADAETQQKVSDLIQEMRKYVGTDQSVGWETLDQAIKDFTQAVASYDKARFAEVAAVRARDEGKERLDRGEISEEEYKRLEAEAQSLGDATASARETMEQFGNALNRTSEEVANFTSGLTTALSNAKGWAGADGFGNIQNAVGGIDQLKGTLDSLLPQMGDGMAKTIGPTLSNTIGSTLGSIGSGIKGLLSKGLGSIVGIVAQIPKLILDIASAVKNFVTGILDAATELISLRWIDDLVVSILDAVGNLIDAIFDLPENLYRVLENIVVNGVGNLLDGVIGRIGNILTFGALSSSVSDWFTNSNAAEVAETIDRLTKRNELLEQAIEDLTDEMKSARGARAIDASTRARELQEETNANYKSIAQAQASYHGAHNSWNYYWDGYTQEQIARLSQQIGRQWSGNLWDLSPEEMKMLRSNVDMWQLIADTGKGPYGESVQEKLNAYIDQAGKLQEITDSLYETLTTTTRDNVFDDFLNSLYGLADGSEDVMDDIANNWQKMVNRMAVNNLVGDKFQEHLNDWYDNLAKLNEARTNGEITDEEYRKRLDALKAEYDGYVESAKRDIETLRTEGIVKATEAQSGVTQSGKAGVFTTMSQDQAGKLEGLFVSGQMHWASMDDKLTDVARQMDEAANHLRQIATNTGSSAQSLGEIKEDIKKMIRDGLKVK